MYVHMQEYKKLPSQSDHSAKAQYIQLCRSLKTFGVTFFAVKEKMKGRNKMVSRLLGITRENITKMDDKTKEVSPDALVAGDRCTHWPCLLSLCVIAVYARTYVVDLGSHEFYTCRPHTHTHTYLHMQTYVHAHTHIHTCTHTHTHIHTHTCTHTTCTHTHTHTYHMHTLLLHTYHMHTHTYTHAHTHTCTHTHMHTHTHAHIPHAHTHTCTHTTCTHTHAHTYHMHTHAHMLQLARTSMLIFLRVSDRSLRCGPFTPFDGGHPLPPALASILAATPTPSTLFERQKEMPSLSSFLATWILLSRR